MKKILGFLIMLFLAPLVVNAEMPDNAIIGPELKIGSGAGRDNQANALGAVLLEGQYKFGLVENLGIGPYVSGWYGRYNCDEDKTAVSGGMIGEYGFSDYWSAYLKAGARYYTSDTFDPGIAGDTFFEAGGGIEYSFLGLELIGHKFASSCNLCNKQLRNYYAVGLLTVDMIGAWQWLTGSKKTKEPTLLPEEQEEVEDLPPPPKEVEDLPPPPKKEEDKPPIVPGSGEGDETGGNITLTPVPEGFKAFYFIIHYNPSGAILKDDLGKKDIAKLSVFLNDLGEKDFEVVVVYVIGEASLRWTKPDSKALEKNQQYAVERMETAMATVKQFISGVPIKGEPSTKGMPGAGNYDNHEVADVFFLVKDPEGKLADYSKNQKSEVPTGIIKLIGK